MIHGCSWPYDPADPHRSGFDRQVAPEQLITALPVDRREAFVATHLLGLAYAEVFLLAGYAIVVARSRGTGPGWPGRPGRWPLAADG
ncbi:hypothetical protein [Micromonospora sp. KC723]|uniref:hypothetical protein n=1 Tax=Micromonospora sp. KC723 TaxID=2530381 RepID=UPI0026B16BA6